MLLTGVKTSLLLLRTAALHCGLCCSGEIQNKSTQCDLYVAICVTSTPNFEKPDHSICLLRITSHNLSNTVFLRLNYGAMNTPAQVNNNNNNNNNNRLIIHKKNDRGLILALLKVCFQET